MCWQHETANPQSRQSAKLFLQSSELGLPHPPLPAGECAPPPLWSGGEGTLACGRGVGGIPIPTRGHTLWCSIFISTLWANPYDGEYKDGLSYPPLRISFFSSFVILFLCFQTFHSPVLQHFVCFEFYLFYFFIYFILFLTISHFLPLATWRKYMTYRQWAPKNYWVKQNTADICN
jgi:hypothetical protein